MKSIKSRTVKLISGFVGFALALSFVVVPTASAATNADLQAQINSLLATINSLQSQLTTTTNTTTMTTGYTFSRNLTMGSHGVDVMNLQKVLNAVDGTQLATIGAGSPGHETMTFGGLTRASAIRFQQKYGITPAVGYVGPITRAKLNSMSTSVTGGTTSTTTTTTTTTTYPAGCTSSTGYSSTTGQSCGTSTTLPTGGALTVTAGSQPTNLLAPASAARVPFTKFTVTAGSSDVTVNSVTVERAGLAQDAVFSGIVLLDQNGMQLGIAKTLNSNHQAMVGDPFVVKAGTSMTLTVSGNMNSDLKAYAGQVAGLQVDAVNTSATVNGSFPITGSMQTVNASLSLGSVSLNTSSFDPNSSQSKQIGTTGYKFSGIRLTAGSAEKIRISSIRWNQSGSASSNDLANVMTYVNGTAYPTTVSADGKYYTSAFSGGILIDKGNSVDIYVQGDIAGAGASGRTVKFDIYKATDVYVTGDTYMYGITAPAGTTVSDPQGASSAFLTGTPWFSGSKVTVTAGTVTTLQKATSVAAQNIAVNVSNQVLGGYDTNFQGEPVSVQSHMFHFTSSSAGLGTLTNVTLVDSNGAVVAGPVDAVAESGTNQKVTFTDTVTYPVGIRTYTLLGKVPSTYTNNTTIVASTTPSTDWSNVTGQVTGNTISLSTFSSAISFNTMTIRAATLAVSVSATPSAQNVVAGGQAVIFANYQFDASQSGEDMRFSSIPLFLTTTGTASSLNTCQLYDGSTVLNTGSNVINPSVAGSNTFTLDQQLVIPKGAIKTLTLKCNVSSSATGTYNWGLTSVSGLTVTGANSGNAVTPSFSTSVGQIMAISTGNLVVSTDSSSPSYTVAAAGSTGNIVGVYKFRAANEAVNLSRLGLKLTSGLAPDLVQVSIWNGATQVGLATFTGNSLTATSTFPTVVALSKDTDTTLTVKVDLASVGTSQPGTQGDLIKVDFNGSDPTGTQGTGQSSGNTVNASGSTAVSGVRLFRSFPNLALDTLPTNGLADGRLMHFKVTANANGSIGLNKFSFQVSSTSATVTQVALYAFNDAAYSSAISGQGTSGQIGNNVATVPNGTTFTIVPATNPVQVSGASTPGGQGATVYFELRASVAPNATSYSVVTTLLGDTAYPTNLTPGYNVATSSALTTSNFVWSGNATSTSGTSDVDFSNGYGLPGLPSGGLFQTRSN